MADPPRADYFTSRTEAGDDPADAGRPTRAPESLDQSSMGSRIPSTITDHPSQERNDDETANELHSGGPIRHVISNITNRGNRPNRDGGKCNTSKTADVMGRPLLHDRPQPQTEYPQRGWAEDNYYDENPWYGAHKEKPIFSLGKPLPHVVRHRTNKRKKTFQRGDEEQGDLRGGHTVDEGVDQNEGDIDAFSEDPATRTLSARPTRTLESFGPRELQRQQSLTTAAGVAHSQKRNDAGQPVFDYIPGEAERVGQPDEDTAARPPANQERLISRATGFRNGPLFKVDGEPLGQQERPEVEEGLKNPDELRNWWARLRARYPEPLAEFLATTVATFMGLAGTLSVNLSANTSTPYGDYETSCWAWGFAWMFGIYLGGGVSGAHMNPAISISLSMFRGFPWRQCAVYVCAQFLASLAAGALAYGCFADTIRHVDPEMTDLSKTFFSTPQEWVSAGSAFFNQVVGGAIMTIAVFALGDDQNNPPGAGMHALVLGFLVTALKFTLGFNIGSALNPASDFGPRVVAYTVGYREHNVFQSQWWLYGPWLATLLGSVVGCTVYDGCMFVGSESPINYRMGEPLKEKTRRLFSPLTRDKTPRE